MRTSVRHSWAGEIVLFLLLLFLSFLYPPPHPWHHSEVRGRPFRATVPKNGAVSPAIRGTDGFKLRETREIHQSSDCVYIVSICQNNNNKKNIVLYICIQRVQNSFSSSFNPILRLCTNRFYHTTTTVPPPLATTLTVSILLFCSFFSLLRTYNLPFRTFCVFIKNAFFFFPTLHNSF